MPVLPQTSASDWSDMPAVRLIAHGCGLLSLHLRTVHPPPAQEDGWMALLKADVANPLVENSMAEPDCLLAVMDERNTNQTFE